MEDKIKNKIAWGKRYVLFSLLMVFVAFSVYTIVSHRIPVAEADNVFDHAVDWEPLQLKVLERDVYYRITLTEAQKICFVDVNCGILYRPDGTTVSGSSEEGWDYSLAAGTYYAYSCYGNGWYRLSEPTADGKTNLTKDANVTGTCFAGYELWPQMTTKSMGDETGYDGRKTFKIVLTERSHIEFRSDHDGNSNIYDSYGRYLGYFYKSLKDEWDAGTYFVRSRNYTNLYYALSAPEKATNITISSNNLTLSVGQTTRLTYTLEPTNCVDTVSFKTTDEKVATVKNDGVITAVGPGTCDVQATTGSEKAALCKVTVTGEAKKEDSKDSTDTDTTYGSIGTVSITKVKNVKKKSIQVAWARVAGAERYQVQCSRNAGFGSPKVKGTNKNSIKFKGLRKKKTYYVRIRAYRGGSYGGWSRVRKVKIKR